MIIENEIISFVFKITISIICSIGLYKTSKINKYMFVYFTTLTNSLCLIYFFTSSMFTLANIITNGTNSYTISLPQVKMSIIMCALLTFLIYHFLLVPEYTKKDSKNELDNSSYVPFNFADISLHYIVPISIFLDWILFDEKNIYSWFSPFIWLILPMFYLIFAFIRAKVGNVIKGINSRYPYFFIDIDKLGLKRVLINILVLAILFIALGYIILFIAHLFI